MTDPLAPAPFADDERPAADDGPSAEEFEAVLTAAMTAGLDGIKAGLTDPTYTAATDRIMNDWFMACRALVELLDRMPADEQPLGWTPLHHIEPASGTWTTQPPIAPIGALKFGAQTDDVYPDAGAGGCTGVMRVFGKESGNTVLHPRRCAEPALGDTKLCEIHTPAPADVIRPPEPVSVTEMIARAREESAPQTSGALATMGEDGEWR